MAKNKIKRKQRDELLTRAIEAEEAVEVAQGLIETLRTLYHEAVESQQLLGSQLAQHRIMLGALLGTLAGFDESVLVGKEAFARVQTEYDWLHVEFDEELDGWMLYLAKEEKPEDEDIPIGGTDAE